MDWKTFFAEIVNSIKWPITIFFVVFLLKEPLIKLVFTLKKLKYKDLELEFDKGLTKVKKLEEKTPQIIRDKTTEEMAERFKQLAEISPQACILDAWKEVEIAARNTIQRTFPHIEEVEALRSPMNTANILLKREILNKNQLEIFHRLRILRNKTAHSEDVPLKESEALEYAISALQLVAYLNNFEKI